MAAVGPSIGHRAIRWTASIAPRLGLALLAAVASDSRGSEPSDFGLPFPQDRLSAVLLTTEAGGVSSVPGRIPGVSLSDDDLNSLPAGIRDGHYFDEYHAVRYLKDGVEREGGYYSLDFSGPRNLPILASKRGRVVDRGSGPNLGNYLLLDHSGGFFTLYAHLGAVKTAIGEEVPKGTPIGFMGSSGRSSGVHLHFQLLYGDVRPGTPLSGLRWQVGNLLSGRLGEPGLAEARIEGLRMEDFRLEMGPAGHPRATPIFRILKSHALRAIDTAVNENPARRSESGSSQNPYAVLDEIDGRNADAARAPEPENLPAIGAFDRSMKGRQPMRPLDRGRGWTAPQQRSPAAGSGPNTAARWGYASRGVRQVHGARPRQALRGETVLPARSQAISPPEPPPLSGNAPPPPVTNIEVGDARRVEVVETPSPDPIPAPEPPDLGRARAGEPPVLRATPSAGPRGTVFAYDGSGFTPNGIVRKHVRKPDGSEYPPTSLRADGSGIVADRYDSTRASTDGIFLIWFVDDATGRRSTAVEQSVLPRKEPAPAMPSVTTPPQPSLRGVPARGARGTVFTYRGSGFTPDGTIWKHVRKPDGSEYPPTSLRADGSGNLADRYDSARASTDGTFLIWFVDDATGRRSETISQTIHPR